MKLYGHPDSGHALKVKFCLNSAEIDHQYVLVDIFAERELRPAEFLAHSKFCEVPLLLDEGKALIQSNAILIYVARKYGIYGGESASSLQSCIEWLVWEANKIGMCLPQLRADKKFAGSGLNTGARAWLLDRYTHDVGVLEAELSDGRPFIMGEQASIADFSLCGYLMFAEEADVEVPEQVKRWLAGLKQIKGWDKPYEMLGSAAEK